jgi:hypothetical protein
VCNEAPGFRPGPCERERRFRVYMEAPNSIPAPRDWQALLSGPYQAGEDAGRVGEHDGVAEVDAEHTGLTLVHVSAQRECIFV